MAEFSYDVTQYDSYPYSQTHPKHIYTLAKLFGINPTHFSRARILELGSAAGGNIIPLAYHYPEAELIGIDLSARQIESGLDEVTELGLKNIRLEHRSILDIDESYGKFDYIICHGVFSWVPDEVRAKIFTICRENLNPEGVACISYNTYPGWNFVNSIREMMLYHSKSFDEPKEKADQARAMLRFIAEGLKDSKTPYSSFLRSEVDTLKDKSDSYLIHEHLEDFNVPYYFHKFIEEANDAGLRYLADTPLATMFHYNLPEKIAEELDQINDIVRIGQYLDFFRNQRFRTTLLCQGEANVDRRLIPERLEEFYYSFNGNVTNGDVKLEDISSETEITFSNEWISLKVSDPTSKNAMFVLLQKNGRPISFDQLCCETMQLSGIDDKEQIKKHIFDNLVFIRLLLSGLVNIHSYESLFTYEPCEKPVASELARFMARDREIVTNLSHDVVFLTVLERILIQYLNGEYTVDQILEKMSEHFLNDELELLNDGKKIEDKEEILKKGGEVCRQSIQKFYRHNLICTPA